MARFYDKFLPPTPDKIIFYGYHGGNYIINGQTYCNNTNLEQVGNYQCYPTYSMCAVAPIVAQCIFEPVHIGGSTFDIQGSRFNGGEYNSCTFLNFGCVAVNCNQYSFKNQTYIGPSCFTVNGNSNPTIEGQVATGAVDYGCNYYTAATPNCYWFKAGVTPLNSFSYCNLYNYIPIEEPSGTFNCFVPSTAPLRCSYICGICVCSCISTCSVTEFFTGDTTCSYLPETGSACAFGCVACGYCILLNTYVTNNMNPTTSNQGTADKLLFGGTVCPCYCFFCGTPQNGTTIWGSSPLYNGTNLSETGFRTFLTATAGTSTGLVYYFLYNSNNGGLQSVDTSTSTNRFALKSYNRATGVGTTIASYKKVSGSIIPSQPDLNDGTSYRFYMMNFNGVDTGVQTISITRNTLTIASAAFSAASYTLTMAAGDQQALYAALGHNNTGASQNNNAAFRRQTVNRIWYSIDGNSVKRLHLGIYNTGGTGLVSIVNGFNSASSAGAMFNIYSWTLNDAGTTATFIGYTNFASQGLRYFCPLDTNWNTVYAGTHFTNDVILTLNATTGLYQLQATMPYVAARLFQDKDGRWATQVVDPSTTVVSGSPIVSNYIDILSATVGQTLVITSSNTQYTYTGNTINGNVAINVYNYSGARVAANVSLTIVGATSTPGIQFDTGSYTKSITTSSSADTFANIQVISSASAKIIGTVTY